MIVSARPDDSLMMPTPTAVEGGRNTFSKRHKEHKSSSISLCVCGKAPMECRVPHKADGRSGGVGGGGNDSRLSTTSGNNAKVFAQS